MKNKIFKILTVGFIAAACLTVAACDKLNKNEQVSSKVTSMQSSSGVVSEENTRSETAPESDDSENNGGAGGSADESSINAESGSESGASKEEGSSDGSEDVSDEISDASTYDGYFFDDEQIVDDYHTAVEFTDDEEFNSLFMENEIDKQLKQELREVENETDMRAVTISYGEKWKNEAANAYEKLLTLLEDKPTEKEKLIKSQEEWLNTIGDAEKSFRQEADESGIIGTQALLASDSAMMNYYKGRAAKLYQQIYVLSGSFELS